MAQQEEADERAKMNARSSNSSPSNFRSGDGIEGIDEELDSSIGQDWTEEDASAVANPTLKPSRSLYNMFEDEASGSPSRAGEYTCDLEEDGLPFL